MHIRRLGVAAVVATLLAMVVLAQDPHARHGEDPHAGHSEDPAKRALPLTPDLQQLLTREMLAIQAGMQALVPAIAAGEWDKIAETGRKIHDSYILRQEISEAQLEELHRALPAEFVGMDHSFHQAARNLAHAAEQKNAEVVGFYFFKLNEGCVSCHSKFATGKFPGFAADREDHGHH